MVIFVTFHCEKQQQHAQTLLEYGHWSLRGIHVFDLESLPIFSILVDLHAATVTLAPVILHQQRLLSVHPEKQTH